MLGQARPVLEEPVGQTFCVGYFLKFASTVWQVRERCLLCKELRKCLDMLAYLWNKHIAVYKTSDGDNVVHDGISKKQSIYTGDPG